jgi:SHAQKYF class myb-like DNA-binding protein
MSGSGAAPTAAADPFQGPFKQRKQSSSQKNGQEGGGSGGEASGEPAQNGPRRKAGDGGSGTGSANEDGTGKAPKDGSCNNADAGLGFMMMQLIGNGTAGGNTIANHAANTGTRNVSGPVEGEMESARTGTMDCDQCDAGKKNGRLVWTPELHTRFMAVVQEIGINAAVPKTVLQVRSRFCLHFFPPFASIVRSIFAPTIFGASIILLLCATCFQRMDVEGMTRENVASHLQKYRLQLKRLAGVSASDPIPTLILDAVSFCHDYELYAAVCKFVCWVASPLSFCILTPVAPFLCAGARPGNALTPDEAADSVS